MPTYAGSRGGGKLGTEECKVFGAYGRDTPNDNGELLLSFSANHVLALLNTFSSTAKNEILHMFNGGGKNFIDYILTRQRNINSCGMLLHSTCEMLGRFARNRAVREAKGPPHIDRRRLTTDPHLRQEVAKKVIGDHLRAFPLSDSSVDNVETAFTTAIL